MKKELQTIVAEIDAFCARLNDGLVAVAIILGFVTGFLMVVHAPALMSQPLDLSALGVYALY